ncbi:MAG: hypothetical protein NTV31_14870 [Bacteroidia bacterium]|nr:hypothetical protein [Bacteroidia bacterium]
MKKIILISAFMICTLSCSKKDDCNEELMTVKNFETEYGCENTRFVLQIDLNNDCTIIRSKETYDTKVTGTCHPEIDFSLYDLVIGKQSTGNFNDTILYDLRKTCPEKELTLTIDVIQSDITQPSTVAYHALIPKLGDEESLNIRINVR